MYVVKQDLHRETGLAAHARALRLCSQAKEIPAMRPMLMLLAKHAARILLITLAGDFSRWH